MPLFLFSSVASSIWVKSSSSRSASSSRGWISAAQRLRRIRIHSIVHSSTRFCTPLATVHSKPSECHSVSSLERSWANHRHIAHHPGLTHHWACCGQLSTTDQPTQGFRSMPTLGCVRFRELANSEHPMKHLLIVSLALLSYLSWGQAPTPTRRAAVPVGH